jgi:hypothetical protein
MVNFLGFLDFLFESSASRLQFGNLMITHLNTTVEIVKFLKDEWREGRGIVVATTVLAWSNLCLVLYLLFKVVEVHLLHAYGERRFLLLFILKLGSD